MDAEKWHKRFKLQSKWTEPVQSYLLQLVPNLALQRAIEIGCGTGAVLERLNENFHSLIGLDINFNYLSYAHEHLENPLLCADGYSLPFPDGSFDFACCHFLLLWLESPLELLKETHRILDHSGTVILFAEPDYGGRIDYPPYLQALGDAQTDSLENQGADPFIGRKIAELLSQAGFTAIQAGILGNQWKSGLQIDQWESEWAMYAHDLQNQLSEEQLMELKRLDHEAYLEKKRVLYVPTFYALARK
jgi:ubiquinone/menaquinone biosynthesis C-methylase UbiE